MLVQDRHLEHGILGFIYREWVKCSLGYGSEWAVFFMVIVSPSLRYVCYADEGSIYSC
jgi:hypothetical protein